MLLPAPSTAFYATFLPAFFDDLLKTSNRNVVTLPYAGARNPVFHSGLAGSSLHCCCMYQYQHKHAHIHRYSTCVHICIHEYQQIKTIGFVKGLGGHFAT